MMFPIMIPLFFTFGKWLFLFCSFVLWKTFGFGMVVLCFFLANCTDCLVCAFCFVLFLFSSYSLPYSLPCASGGCSLFLSDQLAQIAFVCAFCFVLFLVLFLILFPILFLVCLVAFLCFLQRKNSFHVFTMSRQYVIMEKTERSVVQWHKAVSIFAWTQN